MNLIDPQTGFDPKEKYPFVCGRILSFNLINKKIELIIKEKIINCKDKRIKQICNLHAKRTDWHLEETNLPEINVIISSILDVAQRISPGEFIFKVSSMWGAVYEKNSYVRDHDHFGNVWSFVYTVKTFDDAPALCFTASNKEIKLNEGDFIIFPSWVNHHVKNQEHDLERIIIAGNIQCSKI